LKATEWNIFVRSFLIQAGWNYRNFLGFGFAWVLLALPRKSRSRSEEEEWIEDHAAHFNSHPYLAPAALAAVAAMEMEGRSSDEIRKFKDALGSLLGSLGDGLFWNAWRPVCLVAAMVAALLGLSTVSVVVGFLALYNALHLWARVHGVRLGMESGVRIGEGIRRLEIPLWTERIRTAGVLLIGLTSGILLMRGGMLPHPGWSLTVGGGIALALGWILGEAVHRWIPTAVLLVILFGLLPIAG
jgi:mannose/fructose/N-acetylgalactosamine-specific phosphotransferase system component IID